MGVGCVVKLCVKCGINGSRLVNLVWKKCLVLLVLGRVVKFGCGFMLGRNSVMVKLFFGLGSVMYMWLLCG